MLLQNNPVKSTDTLRSLNFRVLAPLPNNASSSVITDSEVCGTLYSNDSFVAKKMNFHKNRASTPDFSTPGHPETTYYPFED